MDRRIASQRVSSRLKIGCLACGIVFAGSVIRAETLERSPENPKYAKFMEQAKSGKLGAGRRFGYVPPPIYLSEPVATPKTAAAPLPSSYDLRTLGKISPVRDQGDFGTCWTFGSMGALESTLWPDQKLVLSENNLANHAGFESGFSWGGDALMSTAYFTRWSGPYLESQDPYPNPGFTPPATDEIQTHAQNAVFLPDRTSFTENDPIKNALMNYGALYCTLCYDDEGDYYNEETFAYYCDDSKDANHAVLMVGWNDNFSAENFTIQPPGDGAFLIKNSFGEDWGDAGYFWVSYYDTSLQELVAFTSEDTDNYPDICQYDDYGLVEGLGDTGKSMWGANIFTATEGGDLEAVAFYATGPNMSYTINIYTDVTASQPTSGTLAATQSGSFDYSGYYTVDLDSPVEIGDGERFSVVVQFTVGGANKPLPVEYAKAGYSSYATADPGQSFYSSNGTTWSDLTTWNATANVCIKAFGPSIKDNGTPIEVAPGSTFKLKCPASLDGGTFKKKPSVYVTGNFLGKKSKELTVLTTKFPASSVICQFDLAIKPGAYSLYAKTAKTAQARITNLFDVMFPDIYDVDTSVSGKKRLIILKGLNLGMKTPSVTLKDTAPDSTAKPIANVKCSVTGNNMTRVSCETQESTLDKYRKKGVKTFFIYFTNQVGCFSDEDAIFIE